MRVSTHFFYYCVGSNVSVVKETPLVVRTVHNLGTIRDVAYPLTFVVPVFTFLLCSVLLYLKYRISVGARNWKCKFETRKIQVAAHLSVKRGGCHRRLFR